MSVSPVPFVTYLESLRDGEESRARGALAVLRRGVGQPPGQALEMLPYIAPWLGPQLSQYQENVHFLVAALFAWHSQAGGAGNLGDSFAAAAAQQEDRTAIERRFAALLAAHVEDMPFYLRQAVSYLRSQEIPINWHQLFRDLQGWDTGSGSIQRRWARSFWGAERQSAVPVPLSSTNS
ncbi:MAG: type I-E CRISPR-associated protein Cse2/CasB [Caldilineaceae bacterium]